MPKGKTKLTLTAAALVAAALAVQVIKPFEGRSLVPYYDIVGVLTWCDGETKGKPKASYTNAECDLITEREVQVYAAEIATCLPENVPPKTHAAFISLAYNIGSAGFCKSSVSRKAKAGDLKGACNSILLYNKARTGPNGSLQVVRGLTNRRVAEHKLCIGGLSK